MSYSIKKFLCNFDTSEALSKFLHECVNQLSTPNTFRAGDEDLAKKTVQNYYKQKCQNSHLEFPELLTEPVFKNLELVYQIRKADVINAVILEKMTLVGQKVLIDFNWKVKWIVGSSKLVTIREPICDLEFNFASVDKNSKQYSEILSFECDFEKFEQMYCVFEKLRNDLSALNTK